MDDQPQLRGILNSGHQRTTAHVVRCERSKHGSYVPKEFPTFCPMIFARIGEPYPALLTRSIVIRMQRAKPIEAIAKIKPEDIAALEQLQKRISGHSAAWTAKLKLAKPAMPRFLENRSADNWRHMLAIAELAGNGWPSRATEAARSISPRADLEKGEEVLIKIKGVFDRGPDDKLSSAEICRRLNEIDEGDGEWKQPQLARELKPFGIYPKSIRIGEKTPKGYERSQFQDAWSRYLKPDQSDNDSPA